MRIEREGGREGGEDEDGEREREREGGREGEKDDNYFEFIIINILILSIGGRDHRDGDREPVC